MCVKAFVFYFHFRFFTFLLNEFLSLLIPGPLTFSFHSSFLFSFFSFLYYLSIYLFMPVHIYLSIYLSVHIYLSIYLSINVCSYLSIYLCLLISIYLSVCPYLSIYLCLFISIYLSIYLCVLISTYLSIFGHMYLWPVWWLRELHVCIYWFYGLCAPHTKPEFKMYQDSPHTTITTYKIGAIRSFNLLSVNAFLYIKICNSHKIINNDLFVSLFFACFCLFCLFFPYLFNHSTEIAT